MGDAVARPLTVPLDGQLKLGELMAFISYLWMLYQPLKWFGDFYSFMVRAFAGAERVFEVIDARSEPFEIGCR